MAKITFTGFVRDNVQLVEKPNCEILTFQVTESFSKRDKNTGNWVKTGFTHRNCIAFNEEAIKFMSVIAPDARVYIEGDLRTEEWKDRTGERKFTDKVFVRHIMSADEHEGKTPSTTHEFTTPKPAFTITTEDAPF